MSDKRNLPGKITIPALPHDQVHRVCLIEQANPTPNRITILKAPAGFGKSNLMAEYCLSLIKKGIPACWISLDHHDSPSTIASHIVNTCTSAGLIFNFATEHSGTFDIARSLVDLLSRSLDALPSQMVLALDDLGRVRDRETIRLLNYLIEYAPRNLHLVVTCKRLPVGLNIGNSALNLHASIIGPDELRFSKMEIKNLFNKKLSKMELDNILSQTNGWPIAVRFLQIQHKEIQNKNKQRSEEVIENWICTNFFEPIETTHLQLLINVGLFKVIDANLLDEILETKNALNKFEFLQEFNGLLCTILENGKLQKTLNPFIRRYCIKHYRRTDPATYKARNSRIAASFRARGDALMAFLHFIEAGEKSLAADTFEEIDPWRLLMCRTFSQFIDAYSLFDKQTISERIRLELFQCLIYSQTKRLEEAREGIRIISKKRQILIDDLGDHDVKTSVDISMINGEIAARGLIPFPSNWSQKLLLDLAQIEIDWTHDQFGLGYLQYRIGTLYQLAGRYDLAIDYFTRGRKRLGEIPYANLCIELACSEIFFMTGRIFDAKNCGLKAKKIVRHSEISKDIPTVTIQVFLDEISLECNELAPRFDLMRVPNASISRSNLLNANFAACSIAIELRIGVSGINSALVATDKLLDYFKGAKNEILIRYVAAIRISLLTMAGRESLAEFEWEHYCFPQKATDCLDLSGQTWREMEVLTYARIRLFLLQGRFDEGRVFLAKARSLAKERGIKRTLMRLLCLSIVLEKMSGNDCASLGFVKGVIEIYRETPYILPLIRDRLVCESSILSYLQTIADADERKIVEAVLSKMNNFDETKYVIFSKQEIEILKFLENLQDKQIARAIDKTPSAVRYHIKNILNKLCANNRSEAVLTARRIGLLLD